MHSEDAPTIKDPQDAAWVARQRGIVIEYLAAQRCDHAGVSAEPRWFLSPYVAVWAVRSKADPGLVGWWAISGELPTDYITAGGQRTTGDVLLAFAAAWHAASEQMKLGEPLENYAIGDPSRAKELAPPLRRRADLLRELGEALNKDERRGKTK